VEIINSVRGNAVTIELSVQNVADMSSTVLKRNVARQTIRGEMIAIMRQCKPDISAPLIVPKGTHAMHRDNPEFFNKAILDFLNQH
jgi:hypothetical protein